MSLTKGAKKYTKALKKEIRKASQNGDMDGGLVVTGSEVGVSWAEVASDVASGVASKGPVLLLAGVENRDRDSCMASPLPSDESGAGEELIVWLLAGIC